MDNERHAIENNTDQEIIEKIAQWMGFSKSELKICGHYENWNPLENIADAWEIVDKLETENFIMNLSNPMNGQVKWLCDFYKPADVFNKLPQYNEVDAETAPRAICKAVLRVVNDTQK